MGSCPDLIYAFSGLTHGESVSYFSCQIPTLPITIALYLHLGGACPPHWVFQGFVVLKKKKLSGGKRRVGRGGWVVGSPTRWLWERVWDFSALGGLTSSISRRVVKLPSKQILLTSYVRSY